MQVVALDKKVDALREDKDKATTLSQFAPQMEAVVLMQNIQRCARAVGRRGEVRREEGMAWHGMAWHGMTWHGMAWAAPHRT